ncbi:MAG: trigger factor [Acidobacteriota bacterium]|nr:MAG: trigger factor [Acidobacteriota bacterium]
MKTELKEISPTQRELKIEIDADVVKASYSRVSRKYAQKANIPGFRKGFAPVDVVKLRFAEEIKNDVLQDVIPAQVTEAIREHDLQPLTEPQLHLEDHENVKVNGSENVKLHVHLEVMPEIPTPNYKGIELVRRVKPVEQGEIEDLIANRLQKEATLIPVEDRASAIGDTMIVDLEGRFDDNPDADPIQANDLDITLGDEVIESSFTDNLVDLNVEDEKEFSVSYPETFSSADLAGKTLHYKAKVKSIGRSEVPELDDDWAKSLDEGYESLSDLREKLRKDLEAYAKTDADARVRNNAIAKLIEENSFEVPNSLIENQARNLLNNFAQDLQQRGVDLNNVENEFIQMAYGNMRMQAERDVMGALLLEKVAELEKVEVGEEEVNEEIERLAEYYRMPAEDIRKSLNQNGGLDNIRNNLKTRKSIEAVIDHAKVTDGDWIDETAQPVVEEEKPKKKAAKGKKSEKGEKVKE